MLPNNQIAVAWKRRSSSSILLKPRPLFSSLHFLFLNSSYLQIAATYRELQLSCWCSCGPNPSVASSRGPSALGRTQAIAPPKAVSATEADRAQDQWPGLWPSLRIPPTVQDQWPARAYLSLRPNYSTRHTRAPHRIADAPSVRPRSSLTPAVPLPPTRPPASAAGRGGPRRGMHGHLHPLHRTPTPRRQCSTPHMGCPSVPMFRCICVPLPLSLASIPLPPVLASSRVAFAGTQHRPQKEKASGDEGDADADADADAAAACAASVWGAHALWKESARSRSR
jgi:hypothetical protein